MIKVTVPSQYHSSLSPLEADLSLAHKQLQTQTGAGAEYTGWVTLPDRTDREELARIHQAATNIKADSQVLVVIGIGGSYLGARAVIELLRSSFYNSLPKDTPDIVFVGNNLSGDYIRNVIAFIGARDFSVNVISKSGTTTEPAVAFRIFRDLLERKYGVEGAARRIYATTDKAKGTLKTLADAQGYETFVVPDDIGGRYSVLTAVGLLPIAAAGIDVEALLRGATEMRRSTLDNPTLTQPAFFYAAARSALYRQGKKIEVLAAYDPDFLYVAEWWKQLYGESEGKEHKGLFPAAVSFTADLHSMGQYLQDGERHLLETVLTLGEPTDGPVVQTDPQNADGLNFLAGKTVDAINTAAFRGTYLAHSDGGVPVIQLQMESKNPVALGQLLYFFEYACGLSGYLLGVNPFDQPGVETYKRNMFALLGKPGFEAEGEALRKRL